MQAAKVARSQLRKKGKEMKNYTIDFFGEKELGYFGNLDGAKEYAEQNCNGFGIKRPSILIKIGNRVVATQEWEKVVDEIGEYYGSQEWQ